MQQLISRQIPTTFTHRHDNPIDIIALDYFVELRCEANNPRIDQALTQKIRIGSYKPHDAIAGVGPIQNFSSKLNRKISGANNQNPFAEIRMTKEPVN